MHHKRTNIENMENYFSILKLLSLKHTGLSDALWSGNFCVFKRGYWKFPDLDSELVLVGHEMGKLKSLCLYRLKTMHIR